MVFSFFNFKVLTISLFIMQIRLIDSMVEAGQTLVTPRVIHQDFRYFKPDLNPKYLTYRSKTLSPTLENVIFRVILNIFSDVAVKARSH